jgi:hypothetical protein
MEFDLLSNAVELRERAMEVQASWAFEQTMARHKEQVCHRTRSVTVEDSRTG